MEIIDKRYNLLVENLNLLPNYFLYVRPLTNMKVPTPPAFIPMTDSGEFGINKQGIIKHWFTRREVIYTTIYSGSINYIEEARRFETFITKLFLDWLMIEEEVTPEMEKMVNLLAYDRFDEVYKFFEQYGHNLCYIKKLKYYIRLDTTSNTITPFENEEILLNYSGDFPTSSKGFVSIENLNQASSFEIHENTQNIVKSLKDVPPWLDLNLSKKYLFDRYIEEKKFDKAWLTLNSTGWKLADVANGLELLAQKTNDSDFNILTEQWIKSWRDSFYYRDILEY